MHLSERAVEPCPQSVIPGSPMWPSLTTPVAREAGVHLSWTCIWTATSRARSCHRSDHRRCLPQSRSRLENNHRPSAVGQTELRISKHVAKATSARARQHRLLDRRVGWERHGDRAHHDRLTAPGRGARSPSRRRRPQPPAALRRHGLSCVRIANGCRLPAPASPQSDAAPRCLPHRVPPRRGHGGHPDDSTDARAATTWTGDRPRRPRWRRR